MILVIIRRLIIQFYIKRSTLRQIYELPKISHNLLSPLIYGNNKCNGSFLFIAHVKMSNDLKRKIGIKLKEGVDGKESCVVKEKAYEL